MKKEGTRVCWGDQRTKNLPEIWTMIWMSSLYYSKSLWSDWLMVPFSCDSTMTTTMFRRKLEDEIIPSGKKVRQFFQLQFFLFGLYSLQTNHYFLIIFTLNMAKWRCFFLQINPVQYFLIRKAIIFYFLEGCIFVCYILAYLLT